MFEEVVFEISIGVVGHVEVEGIFVFRSMMSEVLYYMWAIDLFHGIDFHFCILLVGVYEFYFFLYDSLVVFSEDGQL